MAILLGMDVRYPGTTFINHVLRYQSNPNVKMIVLLGEVCITFYINVNKKKR